MQRTREEMWRDGEKEKEREIGNRREVIVSKGERERYRVWINREREREYK